MPETSLGFPYGESIQWFSPSNMLTRPEAPLTDWLLAQGSLTLRLKQCCKHFQVKVLGEMWQHDQHHNPVWVREVLLCLDGVPWVFARSIIPALLVNTPNNDFFHLGNRPLGELLFSRDDFTPGPIEIAKIAPCSKLARLAQSLQQPVDEVLWGRQRQFYRLQQQVLVSEIFLPAAKQQIITTPFYP